MQSVVVVIIIIVHTSVRLPPQAFAFTFWNYRFRFAQFSNFWVNSQAKWKQEKQPRCELLQYPGLPFLFIWLHQASRHLYKLMYNADGLLLLLILGCCSNNAVGMTFCGRKKKSHDLTDVHGCYITKTTWQWIFDLFKIKLKPETYLWWNVRFYVFLCTIWIEPCRLICGTVAHLPTSSKV